MACASVSVIAGGPPCAIAAGVITGAASKLSVSAIALYMSKIFTRGREQDATVKPGGFHTRLLQTLCWFQRLPVSTRFEQASATVQLMCRRPKTGRPLSYVVTS